jgi:hypothetical protein
MDRPLHNKIKHLLINLPNGIVLTSHYLASHGFYKQLVNTYYKNGWLNKLGYGAYVKAGEKVAWEGAVYSLQHEIESPIHIGGLSSLEINGLAHNIAIGKSPLYLFNTNNKKLLLPKWFITNFPNHIYVQNNIFNEKSSLEKKVINGIEIVLSTPEQAILEVLSLVPHSFEYEHASYLVENLQLIRPSIIQMLLEDCTSFKVKRLFLYLADKYQLPCFSYLKLDKITLGTGKRLITKGGVYNAKYMISVYDSDNQNNNSDYV